jgi:hypothetical protein
MTQPLTEALAAWLEGHTLAVSSGDEMVCACGEWAEFESLQQPSHAEHVAIHLASVIGKAIAEAKDAADDAFTRALQRREEK